jgi:molybdate transport system permease protein
MTTRDATVRPLPAPPAPALTVRWLPPAATLIVLLYLSVPVATVLARTVPGGLVVEYLTRPIVAEALRLSLVSSLLALALIVLLGTPTAYLLARAEFTGKSIVETLLDLPIVLPPAVAGVALLFTFGRRGLFGPLLNALGIEVAFTLTAVVLAQCFVAAPFYIRTARAGFAAVDREAEEAAMVFGAGPLTVFRLITVPLAFPALAGGVVLAWAKAIGEFGATILFAGSFLGRTQTLPLAIYQALETDLNAALVISSILVLVSFAVLLTFRLTTGHWVEPLR